SPDDPLLLEIGRLLHSENGVVLKGVLTHAGGSYQCKSMDDIRAMAEAERVAAVKSAEVLRNHGLPCTTVSVGSTPTATFSTDLTGVTEVRAGVFMFYDLVMAGLGVCEIEDIAVSVLASVIGQQKHKGWVLIDAGWMALSRDRGTASQTVDQGYGLVCDPRGKLVTDLLVSSTTQEHGIVTARSERHIDLAKFKVGSMIRILPNHACATAAKHDRYYVVDSGTEILHVWQRINGW
ncbi:MAG: alanine racemase, partial [Deltaproteobacteria bacterium]|nr:alanine racemase [Deltaproteobacteria bacterium]MBW2072217.1 alanine racemase [Deltaproteobacteria bacterium]